MVLWLLDMWPLLIWENTEKVSQYIRPLASNTKTSAKTLGVIFDQHRDFESLSSSIFLLTWTLQLTFHMHLSVLHNPPPAAADCTKQGC